MSAPRRRRRVRLPELRVHHTLRDAAALASVDWLAGPGGTRLHLIRYGEREWPAAARRFNCGASAAALTLRHGMFIGAAVVSGVVPPKAWRCGRCEKTRLVEATRRRAEVERAQALGRP